MHRAADQLDPANGYPRASRADGTWEQVPATQWTSGFFAGSLWQMYELTRREYWRGQAERWTAGLEVNATRTDTHDLGFLIFDSFGQGLRLTGDPHYRDVIMTASRSLATRYNPEVHAIKSWDTQRLTDGREKWAYPVIIDNMMNLEMLFWAAAHRGDPQWREIAEQHALTSARAHVREDGSSAHVALFDPNTGALLRRTTWQGLSDSSAWARGQAWAIDGFTRAYEETQHPELLETARRVADWYVAHLPDDAVPYWDFRDPAIPHTERDASAAAIAASGLLQLSRDVDSVSANRYRDAAERSLVELLTWYVNAYDMNDRSKSMAILHHAVGAKPLHVEVDVGLVYADYYLLEAIRRYQGLRATDPD
jgi:unsaturated chondroitin disaccharide hydrolase